MSGYKRYARFALLIVVALLAAGCGGTPAMVSCGQGTTGDPNAARFAEGFSSITLVSKASGQPGAANTEGAQIFSAGEEIMIRTDAKTAGLTIRLCIQEMSSNGKISRDSSIVTANGQADTSIGTYTVGTYMVRVIERNVLIANLPFVVE